MIRMKSVMLLATQTTSGRRCMIMRVSISLESVWIVKSSSGIILSLRTKDSARHWTCRNFIVVWRIAISQPTMTFLWGDTEKGMRASLLQMHVLFLSQIFQDKREVGKTFHSHSLEGYPFQHCGKCFKSSSNWTKHVKVVHLVRVIWSIFIWS